MSSYSSFDLNGGTPENAQLSVAPKRPQRRPTTATTQQRAVGQRATAGEAVPLCAVAVHLHLRLNGTSALCLSIVWRLVAWVVRGGPATTAERRTGPPKSFSLSPPGASIVSTPSRCAALSVAGRALCSALTVRFFVAVWCVLCVSLFLFFSLALALALGVGRVPRLCCGALPRGSASCKKVRPWRAFVLNLYLLCGPTKRADSCVGLSAVSRRVV